MTSSASYDVFLPAVLAGLGSYPAGLKFADLEAKIVCIYIVTVSGEVKV